MDLRHSLVMGSRRSIENLPVLSHAMRRMQIWNGRDGVPLKGSGDGSNQRGPVFQGDGPQLVHPVKGEVRVEVVATAE